jgi:hypothetical protein
MRINSRWVKIPWKNCDEMAQSSIEITRSFRKVRGHQQIKSLLSALRLNGNAIKKAA